MSKRDFNTANEVAGSQLLDTLQSAANANFTRGYFEFRFSEGETGIGGNDSELIFDFALIKEDVPQE